MLHGCFPVVSSLSQPRAAVHTQCNKKPPFPLALHGITHAAQRERRPFVVCPVPDRGNRAFRYLLEFIHHVAGAGDAALLANGALHAQVERKRQCICRHHGNAQLAYARATLVARGIDIIAEGP